MTLAALTDSPLSRRQLLIGAGLATGFALAAGPSTVAARGMNAALPGPDDPDEGLRQYLKLTSDLSGRTVYGWQQGLLYGVEPGQLSKPLLGMTGFGCGSVERQSDGSYHSLWKEVLYYTDLVPGDVVETWKNPYNGADC